MRFLDVTGKAGQSRSQLTGRASIEAVHANLSHNKGPGAALRGHYRQFLNLAGFESKPSQFEEPIRLLSSFRRPIPRYGSGYHYREIVGVRSGTHGVAARSMN
jgi:hypothetical protein